MLRNPPVGPTRSASAPVPSWPAIANDDDSDGLRDDAEHRIEDWLVSHLDDSDRSADSRSVLEGLLATGPSLRTSCPEPTRSPARGAPRGSGAGWTKLRVSTARGISLVRFPDSRLLREDDLRTVAVELTALVRAGHHRLVLNFDGIDRMSSQIVGAVANVHRHCDGADGGQLRLCGLQPGLAELFALTGLADAIAIFPDERAAMEAPWPTPRGPRPLPVSVLAALSQREKTSQPIDEEPVEVLEEADGDVPEPPKLRLVVLSQKARGRSIAVGPSPFVIGRERSCQLHADCPAISRSHAAIEWEGDGWVLRDLASTNGTFLNGQPFRDTDQPLANGDEIQVGPLRFTVLLGDGPAPEPVPDDVVASWLRDDADPLAAEEDTRLDVQTTGGNATDALKVSVIEGVLVLTPRLTDLDAGPALETLRAGLSAALAGPTPRQVVIDLEYVSAISSRAVGLLMATFLRLDRQGGGLRLCQPNAPVRALLDQIRLPMLVPVFATLDEAVLNVWA